MKAVITQIQGKFAAVLSDDGRIEKIKNKSYAIGQVIEMNEKLTSKKHVAAWIASAAAIALVLVGGGTAYACYSPYSYVSLDVNPSIEYILNRFDRVLEVKAVNDDGAEILKQIDLKSMNNLTVDEAISITVEQIKAEGFFGENDGDIMIATSGKDLKKAEKIATRLKNKAKRSAGDDVEVGAECVGKDRVEEARKLGTTPGKLNLVQKLQKSVADPSTINTEEWLSKPVKEIMKEIKANKKADKSTEKNAEKNNKKNNGTTSSDSVSSAVSSESTSSSTQSSAPTESVAETQSNSCSSVKQRQEYQKNQNTQNQKTQGKQK